VVTNGLPESVSGQLPSVAYLKRTARRVRKLDDPTPREAMTLEELEFPEQFRNLTDEANSPVFLQRDISFESEEGAERLLIFATDTNLSLLSRCSQFYSDGTFKVRVFIV
jgi:hypothetical protein